MAALHELIQKIENPEPHDCKRRSTCYYGTNEEDT